MHMISRFWKRVTKRRTSFKKKALSFSFFSKVAVIVDESLKSLFKSSNNIKSSSQWFVHFNLDSYKMIELFKYEDFERDKSLSEFFMHIFLSHRLQSSSALKMSSCRKTISFKMTSITFIKRLSVCTIQTRSVKHTEREITTQSVTDSSQSSRESFYFSSDSDKKYTSTTSTSHHIKSITSLQDFSMSKLLQTNSKLSKKQKQQKWKWLFITKQNQSTNFVFDIILHFVLEKIRIRINSTREWDLKMTTNNSLQSLKYSELFSSEVLVEFFTDNLKFKRRKNKTDDITEMYCVNENVYFHSKSKFLFFEFYDSLDCHIAEENVKFNLTFKTHTQQVTQMIDIIDKYWLQLENTENQFLQCLCHWRIQRRIVKQCITETKWYSKNSIIFYLNIKNKDLTDSYQYIQKQNCRDAESQIDLWITNHQQSTMISWDCIFKLNIRMYLQNEKMKNNKIKKQLQQKLLKLK